MAITLVESEEIGSVGVGDYADFSVVLQPSGWLIVEDLDPVDESDEGKDRLQNVEFVVFGDGTVLDVASLAGGEAPVTLRLGDSGAGPTFDPLILESTNFA